MFMGMDMPKLPRPTPLSSPPLRPPLAPRADLYWPRHAWAGGTQLSWEDRAVAERVGTLPRWEADRSQKDLLWQVIDDPVALDLLAVVLGWGTVTVEQALALAGHEHVSVPNATKDGRPQVARWSAMPRSVRRLFGADLIERGTSLSPAATAPVAIRIKKGRALTALLRNMDADRLRWVTSGRKPEAPTHGDRHNLMASELACKLAEHADIAAVLGPRSSAHHDLDITGRTPPSRRAADLTVVCHSGLRIAVEVTCNGNPHSLRKKIVAWIELLARGAHDDMGLRVLFIDASDPIRQTPNEVWSPLSRILAEELYNRPSALATERIAITRWKLWTTPDGVPTRDLARMHAISWGYDGWSYVRLGKGLDNFNPRNPERFASIGAEAKQMAECPAVLRAARSALPGDGA